MGERALQEPLGNHNLEGGVEWSEEGGSALYIPGRIKQETGGGRHSLGEQRRFCPFKKENNKKEDWILKNGSHFLPLAPIRGINSMNSSKPMWSMLSSFL